MIFPPLGQNVQQKSDGKVQNRLAWYLELFIVGTLSVFTTAIYLNEPRWTRAFGEAGFVALLLWALYHKRKPVNPIPHFLIVMSVLYILSYVVNSFMSPDPNWEYVNIRKYIYIIIGGLLFAYPLNDIYKKFMIVILFLSAAIAGAAGMLQYFGLMRQMWDRPHGWSSHPIHYAAILAFVCGSAIFILSFRRNELFQSRVGRFFLLFVVMLTTGGIIVSESRGVWLAVVVACMLSLFLYNRRRAFYVSLLLVITLCIVFAFNTTLRQRATSIVTSVFGKNETSSTADRIQLWKGAVLIFKEYPLIGCGTGNFESEIKRLIAEKKIKNVFYKMHAHNIYFQALAARGIIGFIITMGFLTALIMWGIREMREHEGVGGYIIILSTILTIIGGLTENNIELAKFLAALCFTVGFIGPLRAYEATHQSIGL
jgi:O-antigen ligase